MNRTLSRKGEYILVSIGLAVALTIASFALWGVQESNDNLRAQAVLACERNNVVREAARDLAQYANEGLRSITPNIPPSRATREVIFARQQIRRTLLPIDCQKAFSPDNSVPE